MRRNFESPGASTPFINTASVTGMRGILKRPSVGADEHVGDAGYLGTGESAAESAEDIERSLLPNKALASDGLPSVRSAVASPAHQCNFGPCRTTDPRPAWYPEAAILCINRSLHLSPLPLSLPHEPRSRCSAHV